MVAITTAKAFIEQSKDGHLKYIDLENTEWVRSLFCRMGFVRRAATTGRPKIPDGAIKEAGFLFLYSIIDIVDRYQIPPSLIMNFDQAPLKYAPVSGQTLDKEKRCNLRVIVPKALRRGLVSHFQTISYLCN